MVELNSIHLDKVAKNERIPISRDLELEDDITNSYGVRPSRKVPDAVSKERAYQYGVARPNLPDQ